MKQCSLAMRRDVTARGVGCNGPLRAVAMSTRLESPCIARAHYTVYDYICKFVPLFNTFACIAAPRVDWRGRTLNSTERISER